MGLLEFALLVLVILGTACFWISSRRHYRRVRQRNKVAKVIVDALARYHAQAKRYPVRYEFSPLYGDTPDAVCRWLPELAPHLKALPSRVDNNDNGLGQWLYRSDGRDFKLIFHLPPNTEQRAVLDKFRSLADPERTSPPTVGAYGYWSPGALRW